jgi:drug/metabolite transporter (DMT)-like permease
MSEQKRFTGYLFLTLAMAGAGSTVVASKIISTTLPPFTATCLRFAIASAVFALIIFLREEKMPSLSRKDFALLLLQAGAGSVGYTVLMIVGLSLTSATNGGVIAGTLPAVTALLALLIFRQRPNKKVTTAIALSTAGVMMISIDISGGTLALPLLNDLLGMTILLLAMVCEGLFLMINKKLTTPIPALMLSATMCFLGFILSLVPAGIELTTISTSGIPNNAIIAVAYYALIPTVLGFILWYEGASRTSNSEIALFTAVLPISAVIAAAVVLDEVVSTQQILGVTFVVAAILTGINRKTVTA